MNRIETKKMFYLLERISVGPDERDSNGDYLPRDGELFVTTEPGRKNLSGEPATVGWLGTNNDVCWNASGAFETLEAARAEADDLGFTDVVDLDGLTEPDGAVERRVTARDAAPQWDVEDWLSPVRDSIAEELGLGRASSDAEIEELAKALVAEARAEGMELRGDVEGYLRELRAE